MVIGHKRCDSRSFDILFACVYQRHRSRLQIATVGFWFILPHGVTTTQQPLSIPTQLHLGSLLSRGGSPSLDTQPNSLTGSRAASESPPSGSDDEEEDELGDDAFGDMNDDGRGADAGDKPPLTYAELIIDALSENGGRLSLKAIYTAICKKYVMHCTALSLDEEAVKLEVFFFLCLCSFHRCCC